MSVQEVSVLRKAGRIEEAYAMAKKDLKENPNEWTYTSIFWVIKEMVQKVLLPKNDWENAQTGVAYLEKILPKIIDEQGFGRNAVAQLQQLSLPKAKEVKEAVALSKTAPQKAFEMLRGLVNKVGELDPRLHEEGGWIIYRFLKAQQEQSSSIEIRSILNEYIQLFNPRPSILHSQILNFALHFSKDHPDFSLGKFMVLWNIDLLREEDYSETKIEGHTVASLVQRICRAIVDAGEELDVEAFVGRFKRHEKEVAEYLRQAWFWKMMNIYKEQRYADFWLALETYNQAYPSLGASHWHSEVLRLSLRSATEEEAIRFYHLFRKWEGAGNLRPEDWQKAKGADGTEYASLAVKAVKKSFEVLKAQPKLRDPETLAWINQRYTQVTKHDTEDDWSARNLATIYLWQGENDQAFEIYKKVILHKGEKCYLWAEMAQCTSEQELRIGLLLKALRAERNEDFLGDVRLDLAEAWQTEGFPHLGLKELETYAKHREKKQWKCSNRYQMLQKALQDTVASTQLDTPTTAHFGKYLRRAEQELYSECPQQEFVLCEKWQRENSQYASFSDGKNNFFITKTKRFSVLKSAQEGEVFKVWYDVQMDLKVVPPKNIISPLLMEHVEAAPWSVFPRKVGVINHVNPNKQVFRLMEKNGEEDFILHFDQLAQPPQMGALMSFVVYTKKNKAGKVFHKVLDIQPYEGELPQLVKTITGKLKVKYKHPYDHFDDNLEENCSTPLPLPDFAFVDNYYIHRKWLQQYNIYQDCEVNLQIVYLGSLKWEVIAMSLVDPS